MGSRPRAESLTCRAFGASLPRDPPRSEAEACCGASLFRVLSATSSSKSRTGTVAQEHASMPEVHCYDLHPSEDRFIIMACDGVWDVLGDDDAAPALVRRAFEIGSDDNITALIIAWQPIEGD